MFRFFEEREERKKNPSLPLGTPVDQPSSRVNHQNINILKAITAPVAPTAMSYRTNNSLSFSANNVPTLLVTNLPNALSKSADNLPTTPIIPRIVGFGKNATTYLVPTIISESFSENLFTPPQIQYEECSSSSSDENSQDHSGGQENYFLQVTRQNADLRAADTSLDSYYPHQKNYIPLLKLAVATEEQGKIKAQNHLYYETPSTIPAIQSIHTLEVATRSINSHLDIETSTDSYYPQEENSNASLSATPKTSDSSKESSSDNENDNTSPSLSPKEPNNYAGAIFSLEESDSHSDQGCNATLNGHSILGECS